MKVDISSDTISRIELDSGKKITLLGTAHVSPESVEEVERYIREEEVDHVCLEIDAGRYKSMKEGQKWENLKISEVLKRGQGFLLIVNLVLTSFQRRIGNATGIAPGGEMKRAAQVAEEEGIPFSLADREIQVTLRRAWKNSSFWNKMKLIASLMASMFSSEKLEEKDIEELKHRNALQDMLNEMAEYLPSIKKVLIDERDRFLASNIYKAPGNSVLAVIGAGHAGGIIETIKKLENGTMDTNVQDISTVPPPSRFSKIIPWIIPAIVIGIMAYGFINAGWNQGVEMFFYWFMVNGILSGIGAIIALAHPVTIILSFLLAPLTSLNPTIGVGIVVGLIEAYLRKPRVYDFEHIQDDILSIRGFYRNRITHALVVFFLTSVGSAIGTFAAFPFILSILR
ncbi:MAG: TraB/GumN family protein [Spirochaetia bacterium]|nr:TraB/GumN family protein [Spirochaetia bacterium]MCF7952667.1 TraB/GumN family protein [Spirochaetales bacterium]